jgi:polyhydroxybutyrate depolymerase
LYSIVSTSFAGQNVTTESFEGRDLLVYVPSQLPESGQRALVVVLHGGLGNAKSIFSLKSDSALNLNALAEQNGFIVAYLNGTPITKFMGPDKLGWNAGGSCCGLAAENNIDDVGYIKGAIGYLVHEYGIDQNHIFGMGHSNGAMMIQRLVCETNLLSAAVVISGPLNVSVTNCPLARGKRILALHGADDENVPLAGGKGTKGLSQASYNSESYTEHVYGSSGASYYLLVLQDADHKLDHIEAALHQTEDLSIAEKATSFFGLLSENH